jgi:hypothetical protein
MILINAFSPHQSVTPSHQLVTPPYQLVRGPLVALESCYETPECLVTQSDKRGVGKYSQNELGGATVDMNRRVRTRKY